MINITDQLIILPGGDLNTRCWAALDYVSTHMLRRYGDRHERDTQQVKQGNYTWQLYVDRLSRRLVFDEKFINEVYQVVAEGEVKGPQIANQVMQRTLGPAYAPVGKRPLLALRRGFKLALMHLWFNGVVLLPLTFMLGSMNTYDEFIEEAGTEVYKFFRSYENGGPSRPDSAKPLTAANKEVLIKHAPRVILASDWHRFDNVTVDELSEMHRAYLLSMVGKHTVKLPTTPFPFQLMLTELLLHHAGEVSFTEIDLDLYDRWVEYGKGSSNLVKPPLSEYRNDPDAHEATREHVKQEVIQAAEKRRSELARLRTADAVEAFLRENYGDDPEKWPTDHVLRSATAKAAAAKRLHVVAQEIMAQVRQAPNVDVAHEAITDYFEKIKGSDLRAGENWLTLPSPYPGRETAFDLPGLSAVWRKIFSAWMDSPGFKRRKIDKKNARMAINFLADYIFLYLVWFKEIYPESPVVVPLAPKDFRRVWFIDQRLTPSEGKLPLTLLQLLERRREAATSQAAILYQLEELFDYVFRFYADQPAVAGPRFRSPIVRDQDFPDQSSGPNRSTKIPVDETVYRSFSDFAYAMEGFGQYLQELAVNENRFHSKASRQAASYDTAEWSYIPVIFVDGKPYPIFRVPNLFQFAQRKVQTKRGVKRVWMPHLSVLRCHIGNIEAGQRIQNLRWLDRRLWDQLNKGIPVLVEYNKFNTDGPYLVRIYFGTDKAHGPFDIQAPFRLRACFYREQRFQESIQEPDINGVSWYKFEENHPFGQIQPLFRSQNGPYPYSDNVFDERWVRLWAGFEAFYNGTYDPRFRLCTDAEGYVQFVCTSEEKKLAAQPGGALGPGAVPPHDIKAVIENRCNGYLAVHTEHASRTTYATIRNLGEDIMASQLGVSRAVARYYYAPTAKQIAKKVEYADKVAHGAIPHEYTPADPVNIRAQEEFGKIAEALSKDADAAIDQLGFVPPVALWSSADSADSDWKELLRHSPISRLKPYSTHICIAGGECPDDILREFGERERCGACGYAMRCVDHLRAITGKIRMLEARIVLIQERIRILRKKGENPKSLQIQALHNRMCNDAVEREAWKLSETFLLEAAERLRRGETVPKFHTFGSEFIRRDIQSYASPSTTNENLMLAMVDAQTYSELDFEELRVQAERWRREWCLEVGDIEAALENVPPGMEIDALMGMVKPMLELHGIPPADFARMLSDPADSISVSIRQPSLNGGRVKGLLPTPEEDKE